MNELLRNVLPSITVAIISLLGVFVNIYYSRKTGKENRVAEILIKSRVQQLEKCKEYATNYLMNVQKYAIYMVMYHETEDTFSLDGKHYNLSSKVESDFKILMFSLADIEENTHLINKIRDVQKASFDPRFINISRNSNGKLKKAFNEQLNKTTEELAETFSEYFTKEWKKIEEQIIENKIK